MAIIILVRKKFYQFLELLQITYYNCQARLTTTRPQIRVWYQINPVTSNQYWGIMYNNNNNKNNNSNNNNNNNNPFIFPGGSIMALTCDAMVVFVRKKKKKIGNDAQKVQYLTCLMLELLSFFELIKFYIGIDLCLT